MSRIEDIADFKKNNDKLSTAGQPTEIELGLLINDGFEVVINIRPEAEMLEVFDEKQIVENLGLKYYQIPVTLETLNSEILSRFFGLMNQLKGEKIFLHCRRNIRVSFILALYQIIKLDWRKEKALDELMKMVDVTPDMEKFIDQTIKNFESK